MHLNRQQLILVLRLGHDLTGGAEAIGLACDELDHSKGPLAQEAPHLPPEPAYLAVGRCHRHPSARPDEN